MNLFTTAVEWLVGVLSGMLTKTTVKSALGIETSVSEEMTSALQTWTAMYEGRAAWVDASKGVYSMNLPAAIAGEISRATTIEMVSEITGSKRADFLSEQMQGLLDGMQQSVEFGVAKGGLMFKPYVAGKRLLIDVVQADQFLPVDIGPGGEILGCVFSDKREIKGKFYTRLEYHSLTKAGVEVVNKAFVSDGYEDLGTETELSKVEPWSDILPAATIKGIKKPLYAYFRYPMANAVDPRSPLGVSCYSRAVSLIEQADQTWSSLLWEIESGKRAVFVDVLMFGKDKNGKPILPNQRLYRTVETGSQEGDFFQEWSPTMREANILNALDAILKKIEFNCGLAFGTISNPNSVEKTATEISAGKQRSYSTISAVQRSLKNALNDLLYAMDMWATIGKLAPAGKVDVKFEFDDSIVVDADAQIASDLRMVNTAIMSKLEFRMRNLGEDEATAKKMLALVQGEQEAQAAIDQQMNPGGFA